MRHTARLLLILLLLFTGIIVNSQSDDSDLFPENYSIYHLEFSPDETQIVMTGGITPCAFNEPEKYHIQILDAEDHTLLQQLHGPKCEQIAHWNHDGTRLVISGNGDLSIWDGVVDDPLVEARIQLGTDPKWNADDTLIAVEQGISVIQLYTPDTLSITNSVFTPSETFTVSWHPTDPNIFASGHSNGFIYIWGIQDEPETAEMIQIFEIPADFIQIMWQPTAEHILLKTGLETLLALWAN